MKRESSLYSSAAGVAGNGVVGNALSRTLPLKRDDAIRLFCLVKTNVSLYKAL